MIKKFKPVTVVHAQLTVHGVSGVHGQPALKPVMQAHKNGKGQSMSQLCMVDLVLAMIKKLKPVTAVRALAWSCTHGIRWVSLWLATSGSVNKVATPLFQDLVCNLQWDSAQEKFKMWDNGNCINDETRWGELPTKICKNKFNLWKFSIFRWAKLLGATAGTVIKVCDDPVTYDKS